MSGATYIALPVDGDGEAAIAATRAASRKEAIRRLSKSEVEVEVEVVEEALVDGGTRLAITWRIKEAPPKED